MRQLETSTVINWRNTVFLCALLFIAIASGCETPDLTQSEYATEELRSMSMGAHLAIALRPDMEDPASASTGTETESKNQALYWVNMYRDKTGLFPLSFKASLQKAAQGHATYLANHQNLYQEGLSVHREKAGHAGYLAEMYWERQAIFEYEDLPLSEVIAFQHSTEAAIAQWMESVYHRIPLLDTRAASAAYSLRVNEGKAFGVMEISQPDLGPESEEWIDNDWVAYPPNGASLVPTSWDGKESPQPMAPPGGFPSGPVFTLSNAGTELVRVAKSTLTNADGEPLPHTLLDATNDAFFTHQSGVALYANEPLMPGQTYHISLQGFHGSKTFVWESRFTTTPKASCNLLGQETCGTGKGCYPSSDGSICAWKGVTPEGGSCSFQNECIPGTSCVDGSCRKLCDLESDQWLSCDAICSSQGFSKLGNTPDMGVCNPPVCTPHHDRCEHGTVCQVSSTFSCEAPGSGESGQRCEASDDCASGLACVSDTSSGQASCQELCVSTDAEGWKESELPACATQCRGETRIIPQHPGLGVCVQ